MYQGNNILKHFTIIGGGTVVNMFVGLITAPIITRLVDPNEYGQLSIFILYSNIAVMVLCLGMDQSLVRYFYESSDEGFKRALLIKCVQIPLLVTLSLGAVISLLALSRAVSFEFSSAVMVLLCLFTLAQLVYRFSLLLVRLEYKSKLYSLLNILQKLSYVLLAIVLLFLIQGHDLEILSVANLAAVFICMMASIFAQKEFWNVKKNNSASCSIPLSELIKYGWPFIISMGLTTLFQTIDQISLKLFSTYAQVGIYASTMTLVHIFAIVQSTFNTLWAPMAVEHYTKDPDERSFYQRGNQIITVIMFFIGITLILFKDIFAILLGEKYREAAYILPCLIFNPIMFTISETTVSGLVFMKKSKQQILVGLISCITNAIGNMLLVPRFGGQGAAISTGFSYIVFFSMRTVLSNRYFKVNFKLARFYLLTLIVFAYSLYNTFVKFGVGAILGYLICTFSLVILYWETVKWGANYIICLLKELTSR